MINELVELISRQAAKYGNREVFRYKAAASNDWISMSWDAFKSRVEAAAVAFKRIGIKPADNVAIFSQNRVDMFTTDFALFSNRAVPVPLYATSGKEQVKYIVNDACIEYMFVGDSDQYRIARQVQKELPMLKQIIYYQDDVTPDADDDTSMSMAEVMELAATATSHDYAELESRKNDGSEKEMACLIYTSGTTGEPKGVVLTHYNFMEQLREHAKRLTMINDTDVSLNFLPLTHIFERAWCYFCLYYGMTVVVNSDPREIQLTIRQVQPNHMCCVPRFWEKVYAVLVDKISKMGFVNKLMIKTALRVGHRRNLVYLRAGRKAPFLTEWIYKFFDKSVFGRVRRLIGVANGKMFPTAGAPIAPEIVEFMHSMGININVGYGLTETTATVSCFPDVNYVIGSVGTKLDDLSVKISDDGEILVKGPSVMVEYYKKPEANAQTFTSDGYFRTGDAGHIDEAGNIYITDRIKDLFKTSNGKYIAPQILESRIGADNLVEQVAIIGDNRKYVTALIVPNYEALREYADANGIAYKTNEDLAANPQIYKYVEDSINKYQQELAAYERIKKFALLTAPFTIESGELTNTLKVKRNVVAKKYAAVIDKMYKEK